MSPASKDPYQLLLRKQTQGIVALAVLQLHGNEPLARVYKMHPRREMGPERTPLFTAPVPRQETNAAGTRCNSERPWISGHSTSHQEENKHERTRADHRHPAS